MTDFSLAPEVQWLAPVIQEVGVGLIGIGVTWFAARVHAWTGKDMAAADKATLQKAAENAAGIIFANAEAGISLESIHVSDPRVVTQMNHISAFLPDVLKAAGVTPEGVARLIVGALGKLQAQSTATNAVTSPKAAPSPVLPAPASAPPAPAKA